MGIENLLAQGVQIRPEGMERNALMRGLEFKDRQQRNALMRMQLQGAVEQRQLAIQQAQREAAQKQELDREMMRIQGGGQLDPVRLLQLKVPQAQIEFLANRGNLGKPKVAREVEERGPDGRPVKRFYDDFGSPVGQALPQAVKMQLENLGGSSMAVDPYGLAPGQQIKRTQTPDSIASNATAMRGQNMVDARSRETLAQGGKAPAGYRWKPDGSMEAIPGGPADTKQGGVGAKVQDANEAIALLNQADPLLKGSTGSYSGAAIDKVAQLFGASTPGSINAQQLKAIEGALVAKMPKMSGPQSDKDVQLYRQMAALIGDETVPYERKAAAVQSVREIQERYAGMVLGSSKPPAGPKAGAVVDGYRFKGGNPADKANWEKQ